MSTLEIVILIMNFILKAIDIYTIGMIIYFFMSWVPGLRESVIGEWMGKIYEPFLEPFRRMIPPIGMFDISSIAALIFLKFLQVGLAAIFNAIIPYFA
ncbi:YggT family protein [Macrococcus epidermidis]|uniref:YggT family protein n=2 Tax=Staphylococcaceae TaxID=90964 RepID=A0A2G5NP20_9STAP|nr:MULTISPECIES: YggT family protein [Macrococcus]RAI82973.1 YggT family protein [Macrococcus goetzii]RAK46387.1 YggT family protein [Macrococcus epidermidis]UTH17196.1 YggT family protein [Macrococcus epidermidis]